MEVKWAPVDPRAFPARPLVIDLEYEADCADAHHQAAVDSVPDMLQSAAAYATTAVTKLRTLGLITRAATVFKYEEAGGVIIASEIAKCVQHLAEALASVAAAQSLLARSNVSMAAVELVEWQFPDGEPGPGDGGDDLDPDEPFPEAEETVLRNCDDAVRFPVGVRE